MSNPLVFLVVTVGLIALSAFFVAVEFALLAAKRHRLEDAAADSRSARAALRSSTELTVLLAGSQLGITLCTLALGAFTKPAVHYWLRPLFESLGLPYWASDVLGFVLALIIVTFLHLVVGEMAPKSWAIAHPEKSATMLAIPMRVFMFFTRPILVSLNGMANALLRRAGVEPADQVMSGQNPDDLEQLVAHSVSVGSLDKGYSDQISSALELQKLTVADLVRIDSEPTAVATTATVADVRAASLRTGHLRILVRDGADVIGLVHVRDTLQAEDSRSVDDFVRPAFELDAAAPVYVALAEMRETRNHLAVVRDGGAVVGVITMSDVLVRLLPSADPLPA
ncbi:MULTISPECIES: CNNM domain-containing protein [unclassified Rhodococcus (in: high G+C Gram-positive bacteria)]|uniref:CNNM domain-containing protein n=1 Tax=unclassified Rhodococcus (in: high G+C Gram-positive bacteria) TaxID=192944 RepID=UPI000A62E0C3|nr:MULTISPECIES: hemolysin family protein [unclassified Rhodococcus (in: high G+C Gram-positive bacteria)]MDQ1182484.1 CBS domain containing-hemolysin-like protein [Rhodococcus sp. SORGH_AS_0301]